MPTKLEQEIEEILARTGGPPKPTRLRPRGSLRRRIGDWVSQLNDRLAALNPGQLMLASILLIVGSWFVLRRYDTLMMIVALAGLGLFAFAFILSILKRRTRGTSPSGGTRYWRGQQIDYDDRGSGPSFRNPFRRR